MLLLSDYVLINWSADKSAVLRLFQASIFAEICSPSVSQTFRRRKYSNNRKMRLLWTNTRTIKLRSMMYGLLTRRAVDRKFCPPTELKSKNADRHRRPSLIH